LSALRGIDDNGQASRSPRREPIKEEAEMNKPRFIRVCSLTLVVLAGAPAQGAAQTRAAQPAPMSTAAVELRQGMRELWADHVIWTRAYIVAAVAGEPSANSALARLMKNQEDIGNAIEPYYGAQADAKLTKLLKDHISIAGEVVAAAKAGDNAKLKDADARWHQNAADIATFLSGANPNWKRADLLHMLNEHLTLTTKEATMRLQKNWTEDTATFDKIFDQAMAMADALANGVIKQFPARF
jgi:hypothetical protein